MSLAEIIDLLGGDETWLGRRGEDLQRGIDRVNNNSVSRAIESGEDWLGQFNPADPNSNLNWGIRTLEHMTPGQAGGAMLDEVTNKMGGKYWIPPAAALATGPAGAAIAGGGIFPMAQLGQEAGNPAMEAALRSMAEEKFGPAAKGVDVSRFIGRTPDVPVEHLEASKEADGTVSARKFGQKDWQNQKDYVRAKRAGTMGPGMDDFQLGPNDQLPDMIGGTFSKSSKGTAAVANQRYENATLPRGAGVPTSQTVGTLAMTLNKQRGELEKQYRRAFIADDPQGQALLAQWGQDPKLASNPKNLPGIKKLMDRQIAGELRANVPDARMWKAVSPMIAVGMSDGADAVSRDTQGSKDAEPKFEAPQSSGWDYAKEAGIGAVEALAMYYGLKLAGGKLFPNAKLSPKTAANSPTPGIPETPAPPSAAGLFTAQPAGNPAEAARAFAETVPGKFMPPAVVPPPPFMPPAVVPRQTGFTMGGGSAASPREELMQMMEARKQQALDETTNRLRAEMVAREHSFAPAPTPPPSAIPGAVITPDLQNSGLPERLIRALLREKAYPPKPLYHYR